MGISKKIGLTLSFVGLVSIILFAIQFTKISEKNIEYATDELEQSKLDLLDVCITAKSLADISGCDEQIPEITSSICKDNNFDCDLKIQQYKNTREKRIEIAATSLDSAFRNTINLCKTTHTENCDTDLVKIKQICDRFNGSIARIVACSTIDDQTQSVEESETKETVTDESIGEIPDELLSDTLFP